MRNLEVGMQRPLPGAPQTLFPVTGILWLQQVYLSSFWQYVQNDCTENTLDLVHVAVTEVDWILEPGGGVLGTCGWVYPALCWTYGVPWDLGAATGLASGAFRAH